MKNSAIRHVVMPHMSGQEAAEQVVELRPDIKVVFMSGYPAGIASEHGMFDPSAFFPAAAL